MQPRIFDKANQTLIKTWSCNKLSDRSKGQLKYQLWQDNDDQSFGIALSENESSGGFSAELIKVDQIVSTLQKLYQSAKPFHAVALKGLFIGKSVNNASFLGAALVDQGVIRLHPHTTRLLEVNEDYLQWPKSFDETQPSNQKRSAKSKTPQQPNTEDKSEVHQNPI